MIVNAKMNITSYQDRFLRTEFYYDDDNILRDSTKQYRSLVGGYGTGKTYSLCVKVLQKIQFRSKQKIKMVGIFTAPVHSHFIDVVIPQLDHLLDLYNYKYRYNKNDKIYFIKQGGKTHKLHLKSGEQAKRVGIVGINATDVFDDEFDVNPVEVQKMLWEQGEARLRDCIDPSRSRSTTPEGLLYSHWLDVRSAYETWEGDKLEQEQETISEYIRAETKDNVFLADPDGYVARLEKLYTPKQVQAYLKGYYVNLLGDRVWSYFDEDKHVKDNVKPNGTIVSFWDFGWNDFTYCGFASIDASNGGLNQLRILDEFRIRKTTPEDIYKLYVEKCNKWGRPLIDYCDPAGNQHHLGAKDGLSVIEQMEALGLNYSWKPASIKSGLIIGNNLLHKNKILINSICKYFIAMMNNSSYEKPKNGGYSEKPVHGEHEAPEAGFRYLMNGEFSGEYNTIRNQR